MKSTTKTPTGKAAPVTHRGGKIRLTEWGTYQADVSIEEKRTRRQFSTLTDAKRFIDEQVGERDRLGASFKELSHRQIEDTQAALVHLAKKELDVSLLEAVTFYSKHHATDGQGLTVEQIFDKYMQELEHPMEGDPARPRTISDKRNRLASFVEIFGAQPIERITEADVSDWLEGTGADDRNLRNYKTQVQSLFNYAAGTVDGYQNTVASFPQRKSKSVDPAPTLTPKQADAVLKAIEGINEKSTVTMALGFFAGIRSDEIAAIGGKPGLDWSDIDLKERTITIPAAVAKTGKVRVVNITDNLFHWLKKYAQESGGISWSYAYFRRHRETACKAAGVVWGNNLARHSFATYYAKLHGKHAAAEELGHRGSVAMIEDHYMGKAVRREIAEKYFQIVPKSRGKIITMEKSA